MASYPAEFNLSQATSVPVTIFQCEKCRTILGDSSSYINFNSVLRSVTLYRSGRTSSLCVTVSEHKRIYESQIPEFHRKEIQDVSCSHCSELIGFVFLNLSSGLSHINHHITLLVDKITSYETGAGPNPDTQSLMASLDKVHQNMFKIQKVMMNLNERLVSIEKCFDSSAADTELEADN